MEIVKENSDMELGVFFERALGKADKQCERIIEIIIGLQMFSTNKIQQVWEKGVIVKGYDPSKWRKDFAGAWIRRDLYGIGHEYGWAVDHLCPRVAGGSDDIENLTPLHFRNNVSKAANYPAFVTVVSSDGNKNVERRRRWLIP